MRISDIFEADMLEPPSITVGDTVLVGKFKNRKATVTGFKTDDHQQPVLKTTKGDQKLFKPRLAKLMDDPKLVERVWHGSPHRVTSFSTDHIGTGEGHGRFGWGLYFTDTEDVAHFYRKSLARRFTYKGRSVKQDSALWTAIYYMAYHNGDKEAAKYAFKPTSKPGQLIDQIDFSQVRIKSYTYDVEIPDKSEFLLWDVELLRQSQHVQTAIQTVLRVPSKDDLSSRDGAANWFEQRDDKVWTRWPNVSGEEMYTLLAHQHGGSEKAASLALLAAGVHGIKYLDGNSRADSAGSYNYVLFDGALATIKASQ